MTSAGRSRSSMVATKMCVWFGQCRRHQGLSLTLSIFQGCVKGRVNDNGVLLVPRRGQEGGSDQPYDRIG